MELHSKTDIIHEGYQRVFRPGTLTFGIMSPLKGYADYVIPNMSDHEQLIVKAEEIGLDAIWLRDVPFYDPDFGDLGQLYDPLVYAGWLAAKTKTITIGTAGIVLPLRNPLLVAKQVISLDHLTNGRFILGIASGDRATEYPAFGIEYKHRAARFRDAVNVLKAVLNQEFPIHRSEYFGELVGNLDMLPKLNSKHMPIVNIGRAKQSLSWIAKNTDGWIWHGPQARRVDEIMDMWSRRNKGLFNPYGYAHLFELSSNPDASVKVSGHVFSAGRKPLIEYLLMQQEQGLSHFLMNLKPSRRNAYEILDEFGEYILPEFRP